MTTTTLDTVPANEIVTLESLQSTLAAVRRQNAFLANYRLELFLAVAALPGATRDEYATATGINPTEAYMCLQEMVRVGLVEERTDIRKQAYTIAVRGRGLMDLMIGA